MDNDIQKQGEQEGVTRVCPLRGLPTFRFAGSGLIINTCQKLMF
jgi:hypothetical protein